MNQENQKTMFVQPAIGQLSEKHYPQAQAADNDPSSYDFSHPDPKAYTFQRSHDWHQLPVQEKKEAPAAVRDINPALRCAGTTAAPTGTRYAPVERAKHVAKGLPEYIERPIGYHKKSKNDPYAFLDRKTKPSKQSVIKNHKKQTMETATAKKPETVKKPEAISNPAKHGIAAAQSTNQYHLFKTLRTNRWIDDHHVRNLVKAITKKNLLHLNPLVVDADMNVIDGQHRLEAAKKLGVPVYYIKDDHISENDIAGMNSTKKNWTAEDYINFYAQKGVEEYMKFMDFATLHPEINRSLLITILASNGKRNTKAIKEGSLDVGKLTEAERMLEMLNYFKSVSAIAYSSRFVEAFSFIVSHPEYDHLRMVQKVQINPGALQPRVSKKDYIMMLQNIFNYRVNEKNIVLFLKR
jgi:hypothetical protein